MNSRLVRASALIVAMGIGSAVFGADVDYRPVFPFAELPAGVELAAVSGVAADSKGNVYILQRQKPPVLSFDREGRFLRSFGDSLIAMGHGLAVDPDDNVWATCTEHHMVYKFSPEGKLLLGLGELDKPGTGETQFNKPTHTAFGADGEIFVTDGYGNARIVRYNAKGKFLQTWGKAGNGPGEFNAPHAAVVDRRGRLLVCDRDNERIQIFDREGKLLDTWTGYKPFGIALDGEGRVFISDGKLQQVQQLDEAGKVVRGWGKGGAEPGEFRTPHMLASDRDGNLFVAEVGGKRVQKLQRIR